MGVHLAEHINWKQTSKILDYYKKPNKDDDDDELDHLHAQERKWEFLNKVESKKDFKTGLDEMKKLLKKDKETADKIIRERCLWELKLDKLKE